MKYEISLGSITGDIELPELEDFNGVMGNWYRDRLEQFHKDHPKASQYQVHGYVCAEFVEQFGKWNIKALTPDDLKEGLESPEMEKTAVVGWFSALFKPYIKQVFDPFVLPVNSN